MDPKTLELLLEKVLTRVLANHPTNDDLTNALKNHVTNDDLVATEKRLKNEIKATEKRLSEEIQQVEIAVTVNADKNKADKADVKALAKRVDKIEQRLAL